MQKTIFITGASSGIDRATAKLFYSKKWNVIATMRIPEKETELSRLKIMTILPLDVTDPEQIRETGFEHSQSFHKLFKKKTSISPLEFKQSFN